MTRRRGYPALVWLLAAGMLCCTTQSGPGDDRGRAGGDGGEYLKQEGGTGQLAGTVTMAPVSPVERAGHETKQVPAPGVGIRVVRPDGTAAGSARTDDRGRYRFRLAAGTYRVELETPLTGLMSTKDLPAEVTVSLGRETRLDVTLDTGIR